MIKLNEKYSINNGQGTIVFTEGKRETINAEYEIKGNKSKIDSRKLQWNK